MSRELATYRNHLSVLSLIYCIWFWVPPTRRAQTLRLQGRQTGARQKNTASRSFHSERAIRQVCKSIRYRSPETGVPVEATKNHGRSNEGELHPQKSGDQSQFGECCIGNQWGIQKQWGAVRTGVRIQEERGGWEAESKVLLESTCSQFPVSCWALGMLWLLQFPEALCSWGFSFPRRETSCCDWGTHDPWSRTSA